MTLAKLTKKLKREVAAHPAKAAILGILCVVALWFWTPLVWGWVAAKGPDGAAKAVPTVDKHASVLAPIVTATTAATVEPNATEYPWQQIVQWMEQDPRTKPAGPPQRANRGPVAVLLADWSPRNRVSTGFRDPFSRPGASEISTRVEERGEDLELPLSPPPLCPQDVGAKLTGLIAGPRGGTAIINGRSYRQGEQVFLQKDGKSYAFDLIAIWPGGVVLARDGVQYELNIPLPVEMPRPTAPAIPVPGTLP